MRGRPNRLRLFAFPILIIAVAAALSISSRREDAARRDLLDQLLSSLTVALAGDSVPDQLPTTSPLFDAPIHAALEEIGDLVRAGHPLEYELLPAERGDVGRYIGLFRIDNQLPLRLSLDVLDHRAIITGYELPSKW